jgi:double-stranded uracil-DNA glycosylase
MKTVLPDVIAPGLRVVFTGTAVGSASARAGAYYAGPGNAFWATLHRVGLTPRKLQPAEYETLIEYGLGLTDVCKAASGSDREVGTASFDVVRFVALVEANQPRFVAFNGKRAAEVVLDRSVEYGRQLDRLANVDVFVLPSTSAAARGYWNLSYWQQLAADARMAGP